MAKKDIFGDDIADSKDKESFAEMFAQSERGLNKRLSTGDEFRGEILSIGKEEAFVSTGTPTDALILVKDLCDENKQLKYKVGDLIDAVVTRIRDGEIRATRKGTRAGNADMDNLGDAYDMELPVEGKVNEICNGGFRVLIQGKTAFCPISQIDSKFVTDSAQYVGKKYDFIITQFDEKGRNIVVSRRKLLDLQKAENEGTFLQKHHSGDILEGSVTRIEKFGAFIELEDGIEGLVHVSELGWSRVQDPHEIVRLGQKVQVKLLKTEEQDSRLKISLSIKQAGGEGDPWLMVTQKLPEGTIVKGTVEKKENFGLFVSLSPGISGLLPKSRWRDSTEASQFENKKRGDEIIVQVDQIQFEDKKISLRLPQEADDQSWREHASGKSGFGSNMGDQLSALLKKNK